MILSMVLTAGLFLGITSSQANSGVQHRMTATALAQAILEKTVATRNQYWVDSDSTTNFADIQDGKIDISAAVKIDNIDYNQALEISDDASNLREKEILATVSWQERGQEKTVQLSTILTDWRWLITEEISRRIRLADKEDEIKIDNKTLGIIGRSGRNDYFYRQCDGGSLKTSHHNNPCDTTLPDPVDAGIANLNPDDIEVVKFTPKSVANLPGYVEFELILRSRSQPSLQLTIQTAATRREI
ncbi:MAG: hypothetical protein CEN88_473 [Candidatus Berkelbacteria bacterium Licking1014_2]|uniref:Uncharacterized protein n=1 Tax=Candidatus Berkelbacteria bacterium Licking1014_2 TaxID=2017146 RepID=A0A554LRM9_9BACT|nr:MAG: hypothetical protein CEN88_473 [Candidatus Berkelbacteria bacterium Licking1014_2]